MIQEQAQASIPTAIGKFQLYAFSEKETDWMPHLALVTENIDFSKPINLRIHSECITGDVFGSTKCDCGPQLQRSIEYIAEHTGILIYHRQEGRNIGIINKLKAYNLQEQGMNTAEANTHLGFEKDARTYDEVLQILQLLKVEKVNLLTNNPEKLKAFENTGIEVIERIPIEIQPQKDNASYLATKKTIFGHFLDL